MYKLLLILLSTSLFSSELINTPKNIEPSGIAYIPNEKKLIIVSDNGYICDIYNDKSQLCFKPAKNKDFEGITYSEKTPNYFYVVEEGKDNIFVFDIKSKKILSKFDVPRKYNGKKILNKKGNGLESIAFYKKEGKEIFFFVANQSKDFEGDDRSSIILIKSDLKKAEIINYIPINIKDISDMTYYKNKLYVLSDKENKLYIFEYKNKKLELKETNKIEGTDQEGITIYEKNMYIAQDSGGILKIKTP